MRRRHAPGSTGARQARSNATLEPVSAGGPLMGCWWHGGVLEGGVAAALVAGTAALAGLSLSAPLVGLAFCGTLLVYHLDRTPALSPEDRRSHPARWRWRCRHERWASTLAFAAAAGACATLPYLRTRTLLAGAAFAVPAAAYALPLFGAGGKGERRARRLKDVGAAKPFAVAAAWAGASVLMPALETGRPLADVAPLLAFGAGYRFLYVVPNLLLADAADPGAPSAHLCRLAAGVLGATVAGGAIALFAFGAPTLVAVDLAGPALLLVALAAGCSGRRLARMADCAMYVPAVTALFAVAGA